MNNPLRRQASPGNHLTYSYRPGTDIDTLITNSAGVGAAYTYDWSGNITSNSRDGAGFILYDIYNQPAEVFDKNGTVIQYGYDANGARVEKEIGSSYNCYIRGKDGHTDVILLDLSSDNDIFNTIANGDNIGQVDWTNQLFSHYYYIKDHLGDVRMIMDENGNPQVWNNYYPFGEEMPGLNTVNSGPDDRYGFTSKELDAETGLYHLGARTYDPWSGRFLSVDPLASDSTLAPWSPYQYSFDNPVRFKDPTGKWPDWATLGIEVGSWIQSQFSGAESATMARMNYMGGSAPSSQMQSDGPGTIAAATTQSSMSKLGFHVVSKFAYAEGMGASAGAAGLASMLTLGGSETISSGIALGETFLTVKEDNSSGTMYWNAAGGVALDAFSTAIEEPLGSGVFGFRTGANFYTHFVPPPPSLGFGRTGNEQQ